MKKITITILFIFSTVISSLGYAESLWYALAPDPESASIDGFWWRKACAPATKSNNPASMIESYKRLGSPYSFSVSDTKEGDTIVETTITKINNNTKYSEVTTWYRGKKRCDKYSLKERMAIERAIDKEKKKRKDQERESQMIRDRYK